MLTPVGGTVLFGVLAILLFVTAVVCLVRTASIKRVIARIVPSESLQVRAPTITGIRIYGVGMAIVGIFMVVGTVFWASKL